MKSGSYYIRSTFENFINILQLTRKNIFYETFEIFLSKKITNKKTKIGNDELLQNYVKSLANLRYMQNRKIMKK